MVNGLYTAGRSMMNANTRQDVIANSLANTNTPGFKMTRLATTAEVGTGFEKREKSWRQHEIQKRDEMFTDWAQGPMLNTGNNLDLAIQGDGFFVVRTPRGEAYSRTMSLRVSSEGQLVDLSGSPVKSIGGGTIDVSGGGDVEIEPDGKVKVGGEEAGQIALVDFPKPYSLRHDSAGHYIPIPIAGIVPPKPVPVAPGTAIASGFLEGSNSNSVECMALMISSFRNYEADSKVVHAIESTLDKAINQVARV